MAHVSRQDLAAAPRSQSVTVEARKAAGHCGGGAQPLVRAEAIELLEVCVATNRVTMTKMRPSLGGGGGGAWGSKAARGVSAHRVAVAATISTQIRRTTIAAATTTAAGGRATMTSRSPQTMPVVPRPVNRSRASSTDRHVAAPSHPTDAAAAIEATALHAPLCPQMADEAVCVAKRHAAVANECERLWRWKVASDARS